MCLMNGIFKDYLDTFIKVFIHDILIYSNSEENHDGHLRIILQILRENQLYIKLRKCFFNQRKMQYFGYIVSKEGISLDPAKIKAIQGWLTRTNVSQAK